MREPEVCALTKNTCTMRLQVSVQWSRDPRDTNTQNPIICIIPTKLQHTVVHKLNWQSLMTVPATPHCKHRHFETWDISSSLVLLMCGTSPFLQPRVFLFGLGNLTLSPNSADMITLRCYSTRFDEQSIWKARLPCNSNEELTTTQCGIGAESSLQVYLCNSLFSSNLNLNTHRMILKNHPFDLPLWSWNLSI